MKSEPSPPPATPLKLPSPATQLRPGTFIGKSNSRSFANAILSEVVHWDGHSLPEHSHEWPYVSLLLSGTYHETVSDTQIVFAPFTAVFHDRDLVHTDTIGEGGARFFLLEFGPEWRDAIERFGSVPGHVHELNGEGASWPMLRLYHGLISDRLSDELVEEAVFEICGYLPVADELAKADPEWLDAVETWLRRNFREPYSLQRLARDVHVHPSHLARTFMRFRSRTIGESLSRLRVQEACRQLAELERSLEEIAVSAGFSDQSHMTRVIRQLSGSTPAALRRSLS